MCYRCTEKAGFHKHWLEAVYVGFQKKLGDISFLHVNNKILNL